jgi:cytochrome c-type biogenesis protein CcmF
VLNNLLLVTAAATVLVGTLYPMALEALTGDKISVGPPFFNRTFGPLMVPLLMALPLGPMLAWKRGDLSAAMQRLVFALVAAIVAAVAIFAVGHRGPWLAPFGIALGLYVMLGAASEWASRIKIGQASFDEVRRRAANLPRSSYGTLFAHFGIGMLMIGIVATSAYREEHILVMKPGQHLAVAGYDLTFAGVETGRGPNYRSDIADFDVRRGGQSVARLTPSKRLYDAPPQPTTEAGIHASWRGDLYVVIGDPQPGGGYAVRAYFNPLVRFIWLGALLMFIGGGISLSDRRLRVGAPARARPQAPVAAE